MTETNPSLTEFLLARIAEDAAAVDGFHQGDGDPDFMWGPDRIRAECEAKRRIVGHHAEHLGTVPTPHVVHQVDFRDGCDTLRALALPYASHPEFREEWRQ